MADPIKVYGLPPNKAKNSNPKLRLFSVQSLGVTWNGGDLFPSVKLGAATCSVELYACSDHRSSFVYKDPGNGNSVDLVDGWWRLDPPAVSTIPSTLPSVKGSSLALQDTGIAFNTTQLTGVGLVPSGSGPIVVSGDGQNPFNDPPWFVIPFVQWFKLRLVVQITANIAGQNLNLPIAWTTTVKPGPKETAILASFDMPATWISSFSGKLGYVVLEATKSAAAASFWSERAWALAITEANRSVYVGKTPWTFGLLKSAFVGAPNAVGLTPNPIGQVVYDQLRVRLTPTSNFFPNLVAGQSQIPPGNRSYVVGASVVDQQSANWCVAAAAVFELIRRNPVGFALRTAVLWAKAELVSEYFGAVWNAGAIVPPGGYTKLPLGTSSSKNTTPVAFLDWIWMMAVRIAGMADLGDACNENKGSGWSEIATILEGALSVSTCTYTGAKVDEEGMTKKASAKWDVGKAVLMSADQVLFNQLQPSPSPIPSASAWDKFSNFVDPPSGHTLAFSGHLSILENTYFWKDDGSYRMALYTWGKYYSEVVFGEGNYEDYLRAFVYED
jgi:hypothetical protein